MNGATKETFQEYSTEAKLDTLFDYVHAIYNAQKQQPKDQADICEKHQRNCEVRIKALEDKKLRDSATSAGAGFIGGFLAVMTKKFFIGG